MSRETEEMVWSKNICTLAFAGMVDGGTTEGGARLVARPEMKRQGLVKVRGSTREAGDPRSWIKSA